VGRAVFEKLRSEVGWTLLGILAGCSIVAAFVSVYRLSH
jgi:hypothetical protein